MQVIHKRTLESVYLSSRVPSYIPSRVPRLHGQGIKKNNVYAYIIHVCQYYILWNSVASECLTVLDVYNIQVLQLHILPVYIC